MLSKILSLGDKLELTRVLSEEKKKKLREENSIEAKPFISQIYDIIDDEQLKIAMPIVEGRIIPLPKNARYEACFFSNGGLYKCRLVVNDRYKENGLYVLVVELTSELTKYQRRQYYRLEYTMDLSYRVIDEKEKKEICEAGENIEQFLEIGEYKNGIIIDISGGGIRFSSNEKLEPGCTLLVKIDITTSNGKNIHGLMGIILSSSKMVNKDKIYEQRIEYVDIPAGFRETIIRYIFEQERRLRKK